MKRLEQVAALVVAAGLAIVSYWLFFSWAQGGGVDRRHRQTPAEQGSLPSDRILPWSAAAEPQGAGIAGPLSCSCSASTPSRA
ncbi:hypothetical protein NZK33_20420 [Cyanobium sp. FGCU-6]|nr:hypothetical protein [Cyanobium sp. FGCU6]